LGFNLQGKLRKKRAFISDESSKLETIEELHDLDDHQYTQKMNLIKQSLALIEQEETYWLNRCHEQCLLKGDNNTSYFRKIANGRKRKNTVLSFEKDVLIIEGDEDLLQHATEYYSELFGPEESHDIHIDSNLWAELPTGV
jgi:hypothetical protein